MSMPLQTSHHTATTLPLLRWIRPQSLSTRTVLIGIRDVVLRREIAGGLWNRGMDVEIVDGLGRLAARLAGAPLEGALPNAVVWDSTAGDLVELDAVWRRYANTAPQLVVVSDTDRHGAAVAPRSGVELARRDAAAVVAAVRRALPALVGTP